LPLADPLLIRYQMTQENADAAVVNIDFNEKVSVSESARRLRTTVSLETVREDQEVFFTHSRSAGYGSEYPAIPNNDFNSLHSTEPLFYTATAVYWDSLNRVEIESRMSEEISGKPITVSTSIGKFPLVTKTHLVRDLSLSIHRTQPNVAIHPGSVLRDTFIDPFSSEAERIRFLLDFVHAAQSFTTLLAIDDPQGTGTSVAPRVSTYKLALAQALGMRELAQVQGIFDQAFEKLASNYGTVRLMGKKAKGEVVFYITGTPNRSISVPIGTAVGGFRTTRTVNFDLRNMASYLNPTTGRYSIRTYVEAMVPGTQGNVGAGVINSVNISGIAVTNPEPTYGGEPLESNFALAQRVMRIIASVDSGTYQGYKQTVASIPGVLAASVIATGDPLMERDYDPVSEAHRGGKIDVWIRGASSATVTDTFAFSYELGEDISFEVVGDPQDLVFQAMDARLSEEFPIIEMLSMPDNTPTKGLRNLSRGYDFTLDEVEYVSYNRIKLSDQYNDPAEIDLTDAIAGDYRYRTSNAYTFTRQPVSSVQGLAGQTSSKVNSGEILSSYYDLYRTSSPMELGRSNISSDYLQLSNPSTTQIGMIQTVESESHVLLGDYVDYLSYLGVNTLSLRVFNSDRTVEYAAVSDSEVSPDYRIVDSGTGTIGIQRTETSSIESGGIVLIDYEHDENFTVTYTTNSLVGVCQSDIDKMRHLTADVVIKECIPTTVDMKVTVVLSRGADVNTVDANIRSSILNYIGGLGFGVPLRQSDVIELVDAVDGVSYVVVPITKLSKADDSLVLREEIDSSDSGDSVELTQWSSPAVKVWLIKDPLTSNTDTGGGSDFLFREVLQGAESLSIQKVFPNAIGHPLNRQIGNAFIISKDGLEIPGYTDLETLAALHPSMTEQELHEQRVLMTKNRVVVSLASEDSPTNYRYMTTYYVKDDEGVRNIEPCPVEYLVTGSIDLIYDEDAPVGTRGGASISRYGGVR
jgi:hypothetical protein